MSLAEVCLLAVLALSACHNGQQFKPPSWRKGDEDRKLVVEAAAEAVAAEAEGQGLHKRNSRKGTSIRRSLLTSSSFEYTPFHRSTVVLRP